MPQKSDRVEDILMKLVTPNTKDFGNISQAHASLMALMLSEKEIEKLVMKCETESIGSCVGHTAIANAIHAAQRKRLEEE